MNRRTIQIALAFAIVYLVWGSTYLAIRVGVHHLPPALFAGGRFLVAGMLMLAFALWRGHRIPPSGRDLQAIAVTGLLMLVGANGLVTWAEQWVESNQAALIIATSALWLAGLGALGPHGERFSLPALAGLLLGLAGVGLLVGAGLSQALGPPAAYAGLLLAPLLWAAGSVYARRYPVSCAPLMTAALQTLVAGMVLCVIGVTAGEYRRWVWEPQALLALAYLVVFGSCIAYVAYFWLVHEVRPALLGTYAYVNPAVAVVLGWWLLDERLTGTQWLGTAVILAAVVIVTLASRRPVVAEKT